MRIRTLAGLLSILWGGIFTATVSAQDSLGLEEVFYVSDQQVEALHENDFPFSTDYYYTTGSFLSYRFLKKPEVESERKEQVTLALQHIYYTPSEVKETNSRRYDRPYAGFLGATYAKTVAQPGELTTVTFLAGVAGEISGAAGFQRFFHGNGGIDSPQWIDQIPNSIHGNFYLHQVYEWDAHKTKPGKYRIAWNIDVAAGTKDVYLQNDAVLFVGRKNKLTETIAYRQLGPLRRELFFSVRLGHRLVFHNGLIEGNIINDDAPVTRKSSTLVLRAGADGYFRYRRFDFRVGYNYNTRETPRSVGHQFVTLSISRNF